MPSVGAFAHLMTVGVLLAVFFGFLALFTPLDYLFAVSFGLMAVSFTYVFLCTMRLPGKVRFKAYFTGIIPYFMALVVFMSVGLMVPYIVLLLGLGPLIEEICKSSMASLLKASSWTLGVCVGAGF
ncbi:MAG: hypothetical protein GY835_18255, partial [bacterium]|nr:hypothetical protein [bacterium]